MEQSSSSRSGQTSMRKRSWRCWLVIAALYGLTWIGGSIFHQRMLAAQAQQLYDKARARELEVAEWNMREGSTPPRRVTRDGGPIAKVKWCLPILPGVLVVDSYYVIGPLFGKGGVSLVIYYGLGSREFLPIWGWRS